MHAYKLIVLLYSKTRPVHTRDLHISRASPRRLTDEHRTLWVPWKGGENAWRQRGPLPKLKSTWVHRRGRGRSRHWHSGAWHAVVPMCCGQGPRTSHVQLTPWTKIAACSRHGILESYDGAFEDECILWLRHGASPSARAPVAAAAPRADPPASAAAQS